MDARLDPAKFAGLAEGDAHVIRNAGGRVSEDAIRSLIISHKLLGTQEWFVIHHSDCGMLTFTNEIIYDLLEESLESAAIGKDGWYNPVKEGAPGPGSISISCLSATWSRAWWMTSAPCGIIPWSLPISPDLRIHLRRQNRRSHRGGGSH